jgi:site-specific recombinase XerD
MLEKHVQRPVTIKRLRDGVAGPHIDDFAVWMHAKGFKPIVIELRLRSLAAFTDWMKINRYSLQHLVEAIDACRAELAKGREFYSRGPNIDSIIVASKFLLFLQERGVLEKPAAKLKVSELWPILGEFRSWSIEHKGIRETTLDLYDTTLCDFVKVLGCDPRTYTAKTIREFVLNRAKPHSIYRAQAITVAVRSFLRFLSIQDRCSSDLVHSVPTFPSYKLQKVPRYIEPEEMKKVENACYLQDENGLRDRAVILLLTRLGLRASDVANLTLEDVDWRNGRIAVAGKNRRHEWLPLPQEVGDAILKYIEKGRPKLKIREIFTKVDAPIGPLNRASVTHIVRSAFRRAGIKAPVNGNGAHTLRHSAATAMLRNGVSLSGVGAVFRQTLSTTTAIYAKVHFDLLSEVAQSWPEVKSC